MINLIVWAFGWHVGFLAVIYGAKFDNERLLFGGIIGMFVSCVGMLWQFVPAGAW